MEKKFYCKVCGEVPCIFMVNDPSNTPFACPFDKAHNAEWVEEEKGRNTNQATVKNDIVYDTEQGEILNERDKE